MEGLEEQVNTLKRKSRLFIWHDNPLPAFTGSITQPKGNAITKEAFQKLSYKDRVAFKKTEQPEVYKNLKKWIGGFSYGR